MYFPNRSTIWIGVAEYVEPNIVIMSWGHGEGKVRKEVPKRHAIPLHPHILGLGEFRQLPHEPGEVVGHTIAICPNCDWEFDLDVYADDLFEFEGVS